MSGGIEAAAYREKMKNPSSLNAFYWLAWSGRTSSEEWEDKLKKFLKKRYKVAI